MADAAGLMRNGNFALDALLEQYICETPRTIREIREFIESRQGDVTHRIGRALQRLRHQKRVHVVGRFWAHTVVQNCHNCAGYGWDRGAKQMGPICMSCGGAGWIKSDVVEDPNVDNA